MLGHGFYNKHWYEQRKGEQSFPLKGVGRKKRA